MNYYFEEHAREELRDAIVYYQAIDLELGNSFSVAIENAISLIRQFPNGRSYQPLRVGVALSDFLTESFTGSRMTRSKSSPWRISAASRIIGLIDCDAFLMNKTAA